MSFVLWFGIKCIQSVMSNQNNIIQFGSNNSDALQHPISKEREGCHFIIIIFFFNARLGDTEANKPRMEHLISPSAFVHDNIDI